MFVVDLNRPLRRIEELDGVLSVTDKSILFRPNSGGIKCCYVGSSAFDTMEQARFKKYVSLNDVVKITKGHTGEKSEVTRAAVKQLSNYDKAKDFFETSDCAELFSGGKKNL